MKYQRTKTGFRNLKPPQQIGRARAIAHQSAQLPEALRPAEDIAKVQERVAVVEEVQRDLAAALAAVRAGRGRLAKELKAMRKAAMQCASATELAVSGNAAQLSAAGFQLEASKRVRVGPPPVPGHLHAVSVRPGVVKLRWRTGLRRCWFKVQWTEGAVDAESWPGETHATRGRLEVPGLRSGARYYFRVQAHNPNGESLWSQVVSVRVD